MLIGKIAQWQNAGLKLDGRKEEKAGFEYDESPAAGKPLPLVLHVIEAKPLKVK